MRIHIALLLLTLSAFAMPAHAHSTKMGTMPADGSSIETVPASLMISFDRPARLTRVRMTHTQGEVSHSDRLDVPKEMSASITLTPEFYGPGTYTVEWRAISDDGHPINGAFSFDVTGE